MNNNSNFEKVKAKAKVKLMALLFVFCGTLSGVWEYYKAQTSLNEVLVVYAPKVIESVEKVRVVENNVIEDDEAKPDVVEKVVTEVSESNDTIIAEVTREETKIETNDNADSVNELLEYMGDVKERLNDINMPEISLDKVIAEKYEDEIVENVVQFKEGELEIYDSNKGVVAIEKVEVVNENLESQEESLKEEQVIENKEEKNVAEIVETEDGTIDLMKTIVNRDK